uniref:SH2 domain-containing protein n=1 Tax=Glossina pallidipes TaxID=7398 RepID=A0A1B0A5L1_GLOPL
MENDALNSDSFHQPIAVVPPKSERQEALALKKALEWELGLDSRDLRSHAWYHGPLSRHRAEEIVLREGDFLIRDCTSQPDNYILVQPQTVYERMQYQFEEDAFDAIPDLITFYVGSGKPISLASGARIQYPCNRTYPLSFYGHKIMDNQLHTQMLAGLRGPSPISSPLCNNAGFRFAGVIGSPLQQHQQSLPICNGQSMEQSVENSMSSPPPGKSNPAPRLPSKKPRSQNLTPAQAIAVSNIKNVDVCKSEVFFKNQGNTDYGDVAIVSGSLTNINLGHGNGFRADSRRFSQCDIGDAICSSPNESRLHVHLEKFHLHGKIPTNGFQTIARCTATDDVIDHHSKFTTHSLPRPTSNAFRNSLNRKTSLGRDLSLDCQSSMFSTLEFNKIPELPEKPPSPPPKPNRNSINVASLPRREKEQATLEQQYALHRAGLVGIYQLSGSDSGNGSGDSMPGDINEFIVHRGVVIKNPRYMSTSASSITLKSLTEFDAIAAEEQLFTLEIPEFKAVSKFDVENFSTLLLPSVENKPLDGDALNTFKIMLLETGPKMLAEHLTRIDIGLLIEEPWFDVETEHNIDDHISNYCGLEILTLPQGKTFRNDLIERTQCIKLVVAVTILTCQTDQDRAELLSKWIQIAVETKTALGNLFGFSNIMLGVCMPQVWALFSELYSINIKFVLLFQIQKLDSAWHLLRQKYTNDAFMFEAKLRPTLISMNECSNPQAPNTTVPHVLLYVLLKDRPVMDILNLSNAKEKSSLYNTCITSWESKADDFGMFINYQHLDSSRSFLNNLKLYRKNSKTILEESSSRMDELLSDAFRTEFHIKFLWGSKGATASVNDRHTKLEKVLALMTNKFCNTDNDTLSTATTI